jgi:hypothetical protein
MALAGLGTMIGGYAIYSYLAERDREIFETLSPEDPNWLWYRDVGPAMIAYAYSLYIGGGLAIASFVMAVLYYLIRRGHTFKLKGAMVD